MFHFIDHVAIAVWDIETSLPYYTTQLGMKFLHTETIEAAGVKTTYLDAGNTMVQLLEPLRDCPIKTFLLAHGEGLHHFCLAVDDVYQTLHVLPDQKEVQVSRGGRNRRTAFLRDVPNQLVIEITDVHEQQEKESSE